MNPVLHDIHLVHTDLKPENILLVHNSYRTVNYVLPNKVCVPPLYVIRHITHYRLKKISVLPHFPPSFPFPCVRVTHRYTYYEFHISYTTQTHAYARLTINSRTSLPLYLIITHDSAKWHTSTKADFERYGYSSDRFWERHV